MSDTTMLALAIILGFLGVLLTLYGLSLSLGERSSDRQRLLREKEALTYKDYSGGAENARSR